MASLPARNDIAIRWPLLLLGTIFLIEAGLCCLPRPAAAWPLPAVAAHLAVAAVAAWLAAAAGRAERSGWLGPAMTALLLAAGAVILAAVAAEGAGFASRRLDVLLLVFLSYTALPERMSRAITAALLPSIGFVAIAAWSGGAGPADLTAAALLLGVANIAGFATARALGRAGIAADAQRHRERIFRALLDTAPFPAMVSRVADGTLLYVNQRAAELIGVAPQEAVGRSAVDFYENPEERNRLLAILREHGCVTDFEVRLKTAHGRTFWALASANPVHYGGESALFIAFSDITRRKDAEDALRASELRLRRVLDLTQQAYFEDNPQTNTISDVNPSACRMLGYGREELIGMHPAALLDDASTTLFLEQDRLAETSRHRSYHLTGIRKDGRRIHALVNSTTVRDEDGRSLYAFALVTDITDQQLMLEDLRRREQKFHDFFTNHVAPMVVIEPHSRRFLDANQAALGFYGYSREEMLTKRISDVCPMPESDIACRIDEVATGQLRHWLEPHRLAGGQIRDVEVYLSPIITEDQGEVWLAIVHDVTERERAQAALRESEEKLRIIGESINDAVMMIDPNGMVHYWNPAAERMFGHRAAEILGQNVHSVLAQPGDRDRAARGVAQFARSGEGRILGGLREAEALHRDGTIFPVELSIAAMRLRGEWWAVGIARDITEHRRSEDLLRENESRLRQILESSPIAVYIATPDGRFLFCNSRTEELFGVDRDVMFMMKTSSFYARDPRGEVLQRRLQTSRAVHDFEIPFRRLDGHVFWTALSGWEIEFEGQPARISWLYDISERKRLEEELRWLATTDPLTGLSNRRYFLGAAESELERARRHDHPLAMLMLDIDRFKSINDTYGHLAGDETLRVLAASCRVELRTNDVIGRLGGEEFAIILPETDAEGAVQTAERLRHRLASLVLAVEGRSLRFTVSIGVAMLRPTDRSVAALLLRADKALYRAKESGRNRVVAEDEIPGTTSTAAAESGT